MRAPHIRPAVCSLLLASVVPLASNARASRPDDPGSNELFRFNPGDEVEAHGTEHFVVHYTRAGEHAVPLVDGDGSGVPDHVEELGATYEEVLAHYTTTLGFRAPLDDDASDPGGDPRFDVYLVDFAFSADGAFRPEVCSGDVCAGFLVQENDFAGYGYPSSTYANRLLASHELFHAVQAAYSASQGATFGEGTAVWASEQFDPALDDLELYARAYLEETDRPIDAPITGPVDAFTYGSGIFWLFLSERLGTDVVRTLWEACAANTGADVFDLLDDVITAADGAGFAELFADFAVATLMTGARADSERGFVTAAALPQLIPESEVLPVAEGRFLVFPSSFRTLSVNPGSRRSVRAVLAGRGEDIDGVRLILAPYGGSGVGDVVAGALKGERIEATTPVPDDGFVFVQVIHTRQGGNGARPVLCVGSDEETTECLASLDEPATPEEPDAPGEEPPPSPGSSPPSCATADSGSGVASGLFMLALVLPRCCRGRRRRTTRGA